MKKKVFISFLLVTIAVAIGWNLSQSKNKVALSDAVLSNADALANINPMCPNGCLDAGGLCYCNGWHFYRDAAGIY
ncbi:MAG: NVEALA domain-containing protein [Tannerellaceae bacterium]|jgi:hypothetical protein|nr:NVEALA domain-containing protein [Tannerellaceae bacterium]